MRFEITHDGRTTTVQAIGRVNWYSTATTLTDLPLVEALLVQDADYVLDYDLGVGEGAVLQAQVKTQPGEARQLLNWPVKRVA